MPSSRRRIQQIFAAACGQAALRQFGDIFMIYALNQVRTQSALNFSLFTFHYSLKNRMHPKMHPVSFIMRENYAFFFVIALIAIRVATVRTIPMGKATIARFTLARKPAAIYVTNEMPATVIA